jgi:uncharacterized protein with HEPN domain
MAHDEVVYLRHILDAISRIEEYLKEITEDEFFRNHLVQDGVIRQLEIIGEAAKQIPRTARDHSKNIPWKDIAGMRDKLIHDYLGVDIEQVWQTAKEDLQPLKMDIEEVLNSLQ